MFDPTVGKIVVGLMVISCFGSLFAWQFTIAEVARSSALVGYFPKLFKRLSKAGAPIAGICVITGGADGAVVHDGQPIAEQAVHRSCSTWR